LGDALGQRFHELVEQTKRHEGGNRWIGTGGTSPFGHGGFHPEGVRIGGKGEHGNAVNVWQNREYRNLADDRMLGTRNVKMALRRLRRFARQGRPDQFSIGDTIDATARNGGLLDIKYRAPRRNQIKVLLFFDVGGSMDPYVRICEDLFSAARSEFRHLEYFYFHNCIYERVWRDNDRRRSSTLPLYEVTRTYNDEYKVIVVGDATMSPYEITHPGGSVEHFNEEAGGLWLRRLLAAYPNAVWLNPEPESAWGYTPSVKLIRDLMDQRMYPMTLSGLDDAMARLRQTGVVVTA
ncbi:MAG: VWA domain-containing protein, partial [Pseudomonadota bacterium]